MIIHAPDDVDAFSAGGIWAPTAANFPALKHFFKFNSAAAAVTDAIAGVILNDAGLTVNVANADGTLTLGGTKNVITGAWETPNAKKIVVIHIAKPTSASQLTFVAGSSTSFTSNATTGFRTAGASATGVGAVSDGTTYAATPTVAAGIAGDGTAIQIRVLALDLGTDGTGTTLGATSFNFDGTTWAAQTAVDISAITTIGALGAGGNVGGATLNPASLQVWYFTAMPSAADIKAAALWTRGMITNSPSGTPMKVAYPGWAGIS